MESQIGVCVACHMLARAPLTVLLRRRHRSAWHCVMEVGDTVFFHPLLIHGSGANRTQRYRKAISCHYANGTLCEYIDVKGTTQEDLADEIIEMARKRIGKDVDVSYADLWRRRSKTVSGARANL